MEENNSKVSYMKNLCHKGKLTLHIYKLTMEIYVTLKIVVQSLKIE